MDAIPVGIASQTDGRPGCWAGFGGAVEEGEPTEQALRREVLEETGLQVSDVTFLACETDHEGDGREVSLFYVTGDYRPEDIDLHEGSGVAVHSLQDLATLKMSRFVRRAIGAHLLPGQQRLAPAAWLPACATARAGRRPA
jgi:8-oxo-dGTP pyrophosphatase MutT (NUDIX family)